MVGTILDLRLSVMFSLDLSHTAVGPQLWDELDTDPDVEELLLTESDEL